MHMNDIDLKPKDRELLSFSHRRTVTLPTGLQVEMVVYKFKNDESGKNSPYNIARSGRLGHYTYRDGWDVIKEENRYAH